MNSEGWGSPLSKVGFDGSLQFVDEGTDSTLNKMFPALCCAIYPQTGTPSLPVRDSAETACKHTITF